MAVRGWARRYSAISRRGLARAPRVASVEPPVASSPDKPVKPIVEYSELCCPICQTTEFSIQKGGSAADTNPKALGCGRCARSFVDNGAFVDLTIEAGQADTNYTQQQAASVTTFRRREVSQVYERGWRQGFSWAGFPGAEPEYQYAMAYLTPYFGSTIVDMSCASGLFARRFARSGKFEKVIAADFSGNMLRQADEFVRADDAVDPDRMLLVRADVAQQPFRTGSIDVMHAGAAIHCWPNPSASVAEISRVLKPGGIFIGSTFLDWTAPLGETLGNDELLKPLRSLEQVAGLFRWWSEPELVDLFASVGLQDFKRWRTQRFILFSVTKGPRRE